MPQTGSLFFYETVYFYKNAPDEWIEKFEALLDEDREREAHDLVQHFFDTTQQTPKVGKKTEYTQEPPEVGDMVIVMPTRRYARLIAKSDDGVLCVVKEMFGAYVIPYDKVIRVR